SMGAGEFISVRSQRELLDASTPGSSARSAVPHLDVDANELALVYRARGMNAEDAGERARRVLRNLPVDPTPGDGGDPADEGHDVVGTGLGAAVSSFCFFASGAVVPVLPFLVGLTGATALVVAT